MIKSVYLQSSKLKLSKILMHEFWYDYVKSKYAEKVKLCCIDTDSVIVYIKISDIYKDIVDDFETRFDASNYDLDRPLPKRKNEKVIGLMKEELDEKIMTKFVTIT